LVLKRTQIRGEPDMNSSDKRSEERYRAFIENIHDGVYETDVHGNFTYFNNSFCRVFGYPREEIQFHSYRKFMDNQNARKAYDAFTKVFVTRKGFSDIIWEIIDKDGQKRIIELSANLITNEAGKKMGFRGIARDVTERFRMLEALKESEYRYQCQYEISREAERQYKTLLDFVPYPMVVFRLDGRVTYLNPAFTETFGWNLGELQGKKIPYVPAGLERDTSEVIEKLLRDKSLTRHETKRLTKDGRILDVVLRGAIFSEDGDEKGGQLVLLRDITQEKRMARTNQTLLRISMALPAYPVLEDLLDYISSEIKDLLNTEGALIILLDEEKNELFFEGAAYDDVTKEERVKEIRFTASKGVSGKVIKTGEPIIVLDTAQDPDFYPVVDEQLQFHTRNLLDVPLRSGDRIIGVLMALNKKEGVFDQTDLELLSMIGGTLALSIENARVSKALNEAYGELTSLNRAKDKVINHLSHELKTPVSVLSASLNIVSKKLAEQSDETWRPTMERAQRNLQRLLEIQYQVADIMRDKEYKAYQRLSSVLDETADELEALIAEEVGEVGVMERVRKRIEETFGPKETAPEEIPLDQYVQARLDALAPSFSHRQVDIRRHLEPAAPVCIPLDDLQKVIDGLIKNAIENTPDEGEIEVIVKKKGEGSELVVRDYGVGIAEENQKRIFEGFFSTQDTMAYSSKRPFDFNAGGKGADLLRMKIFSERYNFRIDMESSRCPCLPKADDVCPGRISQCEYCKGKPECHRSGGTTFTLFFPPSPEKGCTIDTLPGAA